MRPGRVRLAELLVLLAIVALAAILRLPGLDQRGRWDADQGQDMSVLHDLVATGEIPLLGPKTSIGTFHHGAAYYYLLAPAAAVSGADPVAVTVELALIGIAAVAASWWLARLVGGPLAAAVAGLLAAVSPSGIDESTFIWNPNPIPLFAALAFAGAVRAWQTGRTRWWLLSAAGAMVTMQLHVLGVVIVVPLVAAWLADVRRHRAAAAGAGSLLRAGVAAALVIAAGYLPLAVHELTGDFSETRAILGYLAGGGTGGAGIAERLLMVGLRSITWPLAGLVTDHLAASMVALALAIGFGAAAVLAGRREGRGAAAWLAASLAWSVAALALFAPSLATITPGLPNDHYHAFLDPVVFVLVGVGIATVAAPAARRVRAADATPSMDTGDAPAAPASAVRGAAPAAPSRDAGAVRAGATRRATWAGATAGLAALVVIAVIAWPPAVSDDGGWLLADQAAARVIGDVASVRRPGEAAILAGIPSFKSDEAMRFPLERRGLDLVPAAADAAAAGVVTIVCDPLFDEVVGAPCGGPAEDAWTAAHGGRGLRLVDRFDAGARRVLSVYAPTAPAGG